MREAIREAISGPSGAFGDEHLSENTPLGLGVSLGLGLGLGFKFW